MGEITAKFIVEILGRPADHVSQSLGELVTRMGIEKGVTIITKELHKTKPLEKAENLWTAFADIELQFQTVPHFFNVIMGYMPAHVEIVEPEKITLNTFELNELSNFIVGRLHNYDALAKKLMGEQQILINKLEFLRNGGSMEQVFGKQTQASSGNQIPPTKKKKTKK